MLDYNDYITNMVTVTDIMKVTNTTTVKRHGYSETQNMSNRHGYSIRHDYNNGYG